MANIGSKAVNDHNEELTNKYPFASIYLCDMSMDFHFRHIYIYIYIYIYIHTMVIAQP